MLSHIAAAYMQVITYCKSYGVAVCLKLSPLIVYLIAGRKQWS